MIRCGVFLLFVIGVTPVTPASAQQVAAAPAAQASGPWSGKAALGYLATGGNTESSSLNSGFLVAYAAGRWTHSLQAAAINSSENGETTAEAYAVGWKSEFNLTERDYLFGSADWRKDRFSGYDQQLSEALGYGRRLIDTGVHFLSAEIGAGARQADLSDGTSEDEFITRAGLAYQWKFSETAAFTQDFVVEWGASNTYFESISAISAQLVGDLALVASYAIKNNSDVPLGSEKTDTFTALSLEYTF